MVTVQEDVLVNGIPVTRAIAYLDKSAWGPGPWIDERFDKIQWQDQATGLVCLAVRNGIMGNWCGYVGVPESHPAFGLHYEEVNHLAEPDEDGYRGLQVHGGLTFSNTCDEDEQELGVCHVPAPGQLDRVWWLGWDAAHGSDLVPGTAALFSEELRGLLAARPGYEYRTLAYVQAECAHLAQQLHTLT